MPSDAREKSRVILHKNYLHIRLVLKALSELWKNGRENSTVKQFYRRTIFFAHATIFRHLLRHEIFNISVCFCVFGHVCLGLSKRVCVGKKGLEALGIFMMRSYGRSVSHDNEPKECTPGGHGLITYTQHWPYILDIYIYIYFGIKYKINSCIQFTTLFR